jgi:nitrite reductase/ring-hydroxylating ferredoxin subunit
MAEVYASDDGVSRNEEKLHATKKKCTHLFARKSGAVFFSNSILIPCP